MTESQAVATSRGTPVPGGLGRPWRRAVLAALYAAVVLVPLALMAGAIKPGAQGRLVVFADALGFAALSLLALQIMTSGRWAATTKAFGLRSVLSLHRQAGIAVLTLAAAHLVILLVDDPTRLALLDPATAPGRARAGVLALLGLITLACTSVWRRHMRLSYEQWRAVHITATAVVLAAGFAHVIWVDSYTSLIVIRWTVLGLVLAAAAALFWTRVAEPYETTRRPYRVRDVRQERGDAVTIELAPHRHGGLRFQPGQFARLRASHSPYGMNDHPFTISSSADRPDRPSFTVKALGDFSASIARIRIGDEVLIEGPHGEGLDDQPASGSAGRLLVAAGIGITPIVSVLRTAVARDDSRPHLLLYGNRYWADVTFREEVADLERLLPNLHVVHTLTQADPAWNGERGRVGGSLVRRYAPADIARWSALICGPSAMVAGTVLDLRRLGMPQGQIQAEGFD
jgi:predicted ferric reductase